MPVVLPGGPLANLPQRLLEEPLVAFAFTPLGYGTAPCILGVPESSVLRIFGQAEGVEEQLARAGWIRAADGTMRQGGKVDGDEEAVDLMRKLVLG